MALLIPATTGSTTGSTPLSQYHSLDPSPALSTSALDSSASSSSVSLTAEDEGKHDHFANCLPCRLRPRGISRLLGTYVKRFAMPQRTSRSPQAALCCQDARENGRVKSECPLLSSLEQHGLVVDAEESALFQGHSLIGYLDAHHRAFLRRVRCSDAYIWFVVLLRCGPTQR